MIFEEYIAHKRLAEAIVKGIEKARTERLAKEERFFGTVHPVPFTKIFAKMSIWFLVSNLAFLLLGMAIYKLWLK